MSNGATGSPFKSWGTSEKSWGTSNPRDSGVLEELKLTINESRAKAIKPTSGKRRSKRVVGKTIDSDLKFIAALTKHHAYNKGVCKNPEPIGCVELAGKIGLAKSTSSRFFKKEFKGYKKYKVLCRNGGISNAIKLLNKEVAPYNLLGSKAGELAGQPAPDNDL